MKLFNRKISTNVTLVSGFIIIILIGAFLLKLPIALKRGVTLSPLDSLFVATSSVCVTGLTTVPIKETFTPFGYVVLCFLMQLGGLGFAIVAGYFINLLSTHIASSSQILIRESLGLNTNKNLRAITALAIRASVLIESIGIIWLFTVFKADYPTKTALGYAVFHSISAFNNAGLDILGSSFLAYSHNISLNLCISFLIILGGLGFIVYKDILERRKTNKLTVHTKIVLSTTLCLLFFGTLLHILLGGMKPLEAWFLSVTSRTAGFETVPTGSLSPFSMLLTEVLMFIGASPGSTGGGIKTTTFFTVIIMMYSVPRGTGPQAFRRQIAIDSIIKAFVILITALIIVLFALSLLVLLQPEIAIGDLFFEVISAFATVGLTSNGTTPRLYASSKLVIMLLMFIGRLGPLTITGLLHKKRKAIKYLDEKIITG